MSWSDALQLGVILAALVSPVLVYVVARARLTHEDKTTRDKDAFERMAALVDRYGKRADELEERVAAAEACTRQLTLEVEELRVLVDRWRAYALALVNQVIGAKVQPLRPEQFGLKHESDQEAP